MRPLYRGLSRGGPQQPRAPIFMKLLEEFVEYADQEPENLSDDLTKLAQIARRIISEVSQ